MVAGVLVIMALGAGTIFFVLQQSYADRVELAAAAAVESSQAAFVTVQQGRTEKLFALLDALTSDAAITDAVEKRDRERLAALTGPRFDMLKERQNLTRWYFYTPEDEGTVFLRAYKGAAALDSKEFGDKTDRATYWQAVESKGPVSGFELGSSALALRAAQPHYGTDGEVAGYMAVGEEISDFLSLVSLQTGDQYALYLDKASFKAEEWAAAKEKAGQENNWDEFPDVVLADSTLGSGDPVSLSHSISELPDDGLVLDTESRDGSTMVRGAFPLYEAGGKKVGAVVVLSDVTASLSALRSTQTAVLLSVAALFVAVGLAVILMLNSLVFRRLSAMIEHMEDVGLRIAGGDYTVPELREESNDEIGQFEAFFVSFLSMLAGLLSESSKKARPPS
jgi:hypothetical protein